MPHKWIFLCYRRQDSTVQAGRIFDVLNARFPDQVFQDVESIDIGVDWTDELRESVLSADVLVVVIGPEWQSMAMERGPRINDPADYVHIEVRTALEHDIRIIPVLLQGAQMPQSRTLPPQLEGLLRSQALPLHDATFESDIARLVARLERVQKEVERVRAQAELQSAARMQQELAARKLAAYAESIAVKPRSLARAGLLALESMMRFPLPGAHGVLRQARAGLPRFDAQLAHASEVTMVAESSNGKWIATGSVDGSVKVWDSATLTLAMDFHTGGKVGALAFEAEERWLAVASDDCKVYVWELPTGRSLAFLDTQEPLIKLLAQSNSEASSLIGLSREISNGHLIVWDTRDWRLLWKLGRITDVAGQAQKQVIAVAWGDHVVLKLTVSGQMVEKFPLQATVTGVAWHQAYQVFAATTLEGELWQGFIAPAEDDKVQWRCERLNRYVSPVVPIAFSPKAAWLAVADGNGLCVLNLEDLSTLSLPLKGQFGIDFTFSRQGTFLAALSPENHSITVWRLPAGRLVIDMELETARSVCFSARESRMISASHENAACVWDLPAGEAPLWVRGLGVTAALAFSPRGDLLAWIGKEVAPNRKVQTNRWSLAVMRATDGEIAFSTAFEGLVDSVAFDVDSRWIAFRSGEAVRVFDLRSGEESPAMAPAAEAWFPGPLLLEEALPESLSERETLQSLWSAKRKWLVTRHPGRIRIWDGTTQSELTEFPVPADITEVSISPNESYLAIGGGDGDLQIRTLPDGIEIAVLPHDGAVTKFAFSPDGNFVVAAGVDAVAVLMWIVSPEILMEDVRRRLDRDLTREEWELYVGDESYSETRLAASTRVRKDRTRKAGATG
jgi:WD40 repeat protein